MPIDEIPGTPEGFFTLLYAGGGVLFGWLVVKLTDRLIAWQERQAGGAPISETKRRWISLGVPAGLVLIGYLGLVLWGQVPFTAQTLYLAGVNAAAAAGAKQLAYAVIESRSKPQVVNNTTNIGTVAPPQGNVYLGSTHNEDDAPPPRIGGGLV